MFLILKYKAAPVSRDASGLTQDWDFPVPCYQSWLQIWVSHPIKFSPSLLKIILSCNGRGQEENTTQGTGLYSW